MPLKLRLLDHCQSFWNLKKGARAFACSSEQTFFFLATAAFRKKFLSPHCLHFPPLPHQVELRDQGCRVDEVRYKRRTFYAWHAPAAEYQYIITVGEKITGKVKRCSSLYSKQCCNRMQVPYCGPVGRGPAQAPKEATRRTCLRLNFRAKCWFFEPFYKVLYTYFSN